MAKRKEKEQEQEHEDEEDEVVWSKLPLELLGLIMAKLPLQDHLHLSSVCRHYHLAWSLNLSSPTPSSPWLILPGRTSTSLKLLSPATTTPYQTTIIPSPLIRRRLFIGSSDGWLVTISPNSSSLDLHLLNPLTGIQLPLPPIRTLPFITCIPHRANSVKYQIAQYRTYDLPSFMDYFFTKAVISTKDFTVVLAHPEHRGATLSYTQPGLSKWIPFATPHYHVAIDVIHDNGLFYAITTRGEIIICGPSSSTRLLSFQNPIYMYLVKNSFSTCYIVRSLHGDLLQVVRRIELISDKDDKERRHFKTCNFMVYRIEDENNDQRNWKRVSDMGEQCLFLGVNESMAFSTLKYPELRRNRIYFTEARTWNTKSVSCRQPEQCDLGVFNLRQARIKPLFYPSTLTWPPPIWFTPHIEENHHH